MAADDPLPPPPKATEGIFRLPAAPFAYTLIEPAKVNASGRPFKLVRTASAGNAITDVDQWFAKNKLSLPGITAKLPPDVPVRVGRAALSKAISQDDGHTILFYRVDGVARIVAILDPKWQLVEMLDFGAYALPGSAVSPGAELYTTLDLQWAAYESGVLFVSHHHLTYAKSSGGLNGFVTAVDVQRKKLLWRSATLTSNAENFVLIDGHLIAGYGFTEEPDFLYVLEMATGKVEAKMPVNSRAEYIVLRNGKLYVRTYDTNYVFEPRFDGK